MLDTFGYGGQIRRYAFTISADAFLHPEKLVLLVLLHDQDESALGFLQRTEVYSRILGRDYSVNGIDARPKVAVLCPEGLGAPTVGNFGDEAKPKASAVWGSVSQTLCTWNMPCAGPGQLTGVREVPFVLYAMGRFEGLVSEWIRKRTGTAPTGAVFPKVVIAGHGVGAMLAAACAAERPDRFSALVMWGGCNRAQSPAGVGRPAIDSLFVPTSPFAVFSYGALGELDDWFPLAGGQPAPALERAAAVLGPDLDSVPYTHAIGRPQSSFERFLLAQKKGPLPARPPAAVVTDLGGNFNRTTYRDAVGDVRGVFDSVPLGTHTLDPYWMERTWQTLLDHGVA